MEHDLAVSIVSHNTADALKSCLSHVQASRFSGSLEIVVVDNASGDESVKVARSFPGVSVVALPENVFYSRANNVAWRTTTSRYFLVLNPDCDLHPDALAGCVSRLDERPWVGAVTVQTRTDEGDVQHITARRFMGPRSAILLFTAVGTLLPRLRSREESWLLYEEWDRASSRPVQFCQGSCLMVRRSAVRGDLFDESMVMYFSDEDLCRGLAEDAWHLEYVVEASAVHHQSLSVRKAPPERIRMVYLSDLRAFSRKHYGWLLSTLFLALVRASEMIPGFRAGPHLWPEDGLAARVARRAALVLRRRSRR